ncbi:hypothetical protein BC943DRAFT_319551 [Umbelopsis sp. AD052]|nr:hypothetical protein BC943DRAFT_319551 [Umbelopsis sp. AD052]
MDVNSQINTVWRVCDNNPDNICHCDWRLTIKNCAEERVMNIVYIINIALSAITVLFGLYMLAKRVFFQGHSFVIRSEGRGLFRPKPVECLLLFITIFSILRLVSSLVLVLDIAPGNMIFRSFIFEIPWQWGFGGFVLYLIGIAQTLADSHKAISKGWLPSPILVDVFGFSLLLLPFIANNTCSLIAGAMLDAGHDRVAQIFIRLLYVFWFVEDSTLAISVVWAGSRLVQLLTRHLFQFRVTGERYSSIKGGIVKIKLVIVIAGIGLSGFASFLLLYGILRDYIMTSTVGSAILGGIWTWLGAFMCISCEAAVAISPKMASPSVGLPDSSADPYTGRTGVSSGGGYSSYHSKGEAESYGKYSPSPAALVALNTLSNTPSCFVPRYDEEKYYSPTGLPMDEGIGSGTLSEIRLIGEAK